MDTVPFNHTMDDARWSFSSLFLVIGATITLLTTRPRGWNQAIWSFAILTLGFLLHISQGPPAASTAGYLHFAEIVAYPLFTIGAIRSLTGRQMGKFVGVDSSLDSLPTFEEIAFLEVAADLATSPFSDDETQFERQAVEILSRGLKIDLSILLRSNQLAGRIEIITGFDLHEERPIPISAFDSSLFPELNDALRSGNYHHMEPDARKSELYAMDSVVGRKVKQSLHLFPLRSGREVFGGLLTSAPKSYPLNSSINQARMREVVSILAERIEKWRARATQNGGLLEFGDQDDQGYQIQKLQNENVKLEEALLALQRKFQDSQLVNGDVGYPIQHDSQEEIQRLEAEVLRLTSALAFQDDSAKDEQIEQLVSERQIALEELAAVRNAMALLEQVSEDEAVEDVVQFAGSDKESFIKIAQELRRPMSASQIYTDLLLNEVVGILGTMQTNFLERIQSAADNVGFLLNELTRVNPAEISGLHIQHEKVNLTECLDAALNMGSTKIKEREVVLRIDFPDEHPTLLADEDTVIQILYHLLNHAISISPQGEQIELLSGEKNAEKQRFLTISVSDAGEWISPERRKEIVQVDEQDNEFFSPKPEDSLLSARSLVLMLGGRIWVEQRVESGNRVTILLPIVDERVPAH
jgi:signal transduction histidine kinase